VVSVAELDRWRIEARRWLEDAREDLAAARDLAATHHYALACFHCQQAAEKAVKAVLYANHVEARGHSVTALLDELSRRKGLKLGEDHIRNARLLDKHYSPPRYPNLHPGIELPAHELYGKEDAQACLKAAEELLKFLEELLRLLGATSSS